MKHLLKYLIPFILAFFLVGVAATLAEVPADREKLTEPGEILFKSYCTSCHGLRGKGDGPAAGAMIKKPADLTKIAKRRDGRFGFVEIASIIDGRTKMPSHGNREMPVWGRKFGEDLKDKVLKEELISGNLLALVMYLESIQN